MCGRHVFSLEFFDVLSVFCRDLFVDDGRLQLRNLSEWHVLGRDGLHQLRPVPTRNYIHGWSHFLHVKQWFNDPVRPASIRY